MASVAVFWLAPEFRKCLKRLMWGSSKPLIVETRPLRSNFDSFRFTSDRHVRMMSVIRVLQTVSRQDLAAAKTGLKRAKTPGILLNDSVGRIAF